MKRRWWLPLVFLVPFTPFGVAVVAHAPLRGADVVDLAGEWRMLDDARPPSTITAADLEAFTPVTLPGKLPEIEHELILGRTFDLDEAGAGRRSMLTFGGVNNGIATVFVNGAWVGTEGVSETGYKLEHVALSQYAVAPDRLRVGKNTVVIAAAPEDRWSKRPSISVVDHRLLFGPSDVLRPWFDRVIVIERLLELGGLLLLVFIAALAFALSLAEPDRAARKLQWATAALAAAIAVYLSGKSGVAIALGLWREVVPQAVTAIGLFMPELVERAFGRETRFLKVNRVICLAHIFVQFFVFNAFIYLIFIPWLFIIMAWGAYLAIRAVRHQPTVETVLLVGSILAMVAAGVNDLLTDLGVLATPRLFTVAAVDMAWVGSVFVVSRFLRTMRENVELLGSVESKNRELVGALARAEESTKLKSAFLANTSHELRTPLNSIINVPEGLLEEFVQKPFIACSACHCLFEAPEGYVAKATDACPECREVGTLATELRAVFAGDPDAAMGYLRAIQQSGRHLLAVVSDVLDFSKIEAGKMTVRQERTVLREVLEKLALAMGPLAASRRITIQVDDIDVAETMLSDDVKLTQVLMNLVSNAIKFSPDSSEVAVKADLTADRVVLRVVDHGIGIAAVDRERIFESFLQLDDSHTRRQGGTGLGLAITKKIVELMNGTVRVESTPGQGSTFIVDLPRLH